MELSGSWVALVTPLGDDGKIDFARTASLVDWHRAAGTSGLVIAGTTGEAALLTDDEFRQLLGFVVDHVQGSLPIVAGAGTTSTRRSIDLSRIAFDAGADALLLVSPYYLKTSQPGLVAHYAAIADAVDLPQILYNVPARTGCDLLPETAAEIAKVANVVAVKEALPDLDRVRALVEMLPASVAVLSGDDPTSLAAMGCGAKGVISVTANVAPKQIAQLCRLWDEGHWDDAETLDRSLAPLHEALFLEPNPIPVKWALARMGLIGGQLRMPLVELSAPNQNRLEQVLRSLGLDGPT